MQTSGYYAYIIGDDGRIQNRVVILCDDDDEAKRCVQRLVDGHAVELWQEACKVARFEPTTPEPKQEHKPVRRFGPAEGELGVPPMRRCYFDLRDDEGTQFADPQALRLAPGLAWRSKSATTPVP